MKESAAATADWPAHLDRKSWAAGVLDSKCRFGFKDDKDGQPASTYIRMNTSPLIGMALTEILGGVWDGKAGIYWVPADEQKDWLEQVIHYLRDKHEIASKLYRWRLTSPDRRIGWSVGKATREFRKGLRN